MEAQAWLTDPPVLTIPAADYPGTKCPLKFHLIHISCHFPYPFLGSVGVEITAVSGGFRIGTSLGIAGT